MSKTKQKDRKPTMNEMKTVVNNLIREMAKIQDAIMQLDSIIYGYIEYNNHGQKYREWLTEKAKEAAENERNEGSSSGDNKHSNRGAEASQVSS